jgi:hypothetical protein
MINATKAYLTNNMLEVTINNKDYASLYGGAPDLMQIDPYVPLGTHIAQLARQGRFLGLTFGDTQLKARLGYPEEANRIKNVLLPLVEDPHVHHPFDRSTIIGNLLALFMNNPTAFSQFVKQRPFVLSASRYIDVTKLLNRTTKKYGEIFSQTNLDELIQSLYDQSIIRRDIAIGINGQSYPQTIRPLMQVVDEIHKRLKDQIPEIDLQYQTLMEKDNNRAGYTSTDIRSLLTLLMLFDPWDTVTGIPHVIDSTLLY